MMLTDSGTNSAMRLDAWMGDENQKDVRLIYLMLSERLLPTSSSAVEPTNKRTEPFEYRLSAAVLADRELPRLPGSIGATW
jgi:hypothetical protein